MFKFYEVGGCVRDEILGLKSKDVDYVAVPREELLKGIAETGVYVDDRIEGQAPAHAAGWRFIWAKQDWQWNQ